MNIHSRRGFVSLVLVLVIVLATTAVTGAGYGIYKYQQTSKENKVLKEEAEAQKDQQIEALQEELETLTTEASDGVSTSTEEKDVPVVNRKTTDTKVAPPVNTVVKEVSTVITPVVSQADSATLLSETCKAQRDAKKTKLWNAMLVAVDLAEQQKEGEKLDSLMSSLPPGSMSAGNVFNLAKTSPEEHEENLSIAETQMESTLAEFYEDCLQGA